MTTSRGKGQARRRRSLAAHDDLAAILADTIDQIGRRAQRLFRERAHRELSGKLAARRWVFGEGDLPTPAVSADGLWDEAAWGEAVDDSEDLIGGFVVDEMARVGVTARISQPFVQEIVAGHLAAIEAYGDEARLHVKTVLVDALRDGASVDRAAGMLVGGDMRPRAAELVARTEMVAAGNGAAMVGAKAAARPGDVKVWLSTPDQRTRPDHAAANGQEVPLDQPFRVGGEKADYPGDPGLSLSQRGLCRCSWYVRQAER